MFKDKWLLKGHESKTIVINVLATHFYILVFLYLYKRLYITLYLCQVMNNKR